MTTVRTETTQVAIVGGGPAGLMLAHLLRAGGVDVVVLEHRTRTAIEQTSRAGILEADTVRMLVESGVSDRVLREGVAHDGISLRFGGEHHRVDFQATVGESVRLYPQTDVFLDLAAAHDRDGGDVRYDVSGTRVVDLTTDRPGVLFTDAEGNDREVRARVVVGADGSRSMCRHEIPESARRQYTREYPFAWFGILCEAPPSHPELVYANSPRGFALISQRTPTVQRMYFECDPAEDASAWSDDRIWAELQQRVAGDDGFELVQGPVIDRSVLAFRSFVLEPMRHGRLLLAGDAAHTVPPTGAKGLNLALADVRVLAEVLLDFTARDDADVLDVYGPRALERVWRAQHFSYWMTTMLHAVGDEFDRRRQLGELTSLVTSEAGARYLAEGYTGWPGRS
ncbi:4-hydroxybenzoate 3-monooxygenase [Jatrophihabitans sp. YIM 134969]